MRFFLTFIICIVHYISFSQTVVIAKKTKDAIYVAADSRVVLEKPDDLTNKVFRDTFITCKILHTGNFNFAFIGANIAEGWRVATYSVEQSQTIALVTEIFITKFANAIANDLAHIKKTQGLDYYKSYITKRATTISQVILFGVDLHSLFMKEAFFKIDDAYTNDTSYLPKVLFAIQDVEAAAAGHIEEISVKLNSKEIFKNNIVKTMKYLINTESHYHPYEVGGPIDIIKVTKTKTEWIQHKQMCE